MSDLFRLLYQKGATSDAGASTQFTVDRENKLATAQRDTGFLGRVVENLSVRFSATQRERNRAAFDAYVGEIAAVNQELAELISAELQDIRTRGRPLTLRDVQQVVASKGADGQGVLATVEAEARALLQTLQLAGPDWPQWHNPATVARVRQTLELAQVHLSGVDDGEAKTTLATLARQIAEATGDKTELWIVPQAQFDTRAQARLQVFHPGLGQLIQTPVTNAQWKALLKAHDGYRDGKVPKPKQAQAVRHTALSVIKSTGLHRGLRYLEKAPTPALVALARQVGLGIYSEFDALREAQTEADAHALDPDSRRLLQAWNDAGVDAQRAVEVEGEPTPGTASAAPVARARGIEQEDRAFREEQPGIKELRAFFAECLSPSNPADLEALAPAERLRNACVAYPGAFRELLLQAATLASATPDAEDEAVDSSEIPPAVKLAMAALIDDATKAKLAQADSPTAADAILAAALGQLPAARLDAFSAAIDGSLAVYQPQVTQVLQLLAQGFQGVPGNLATFLGHAFSTYYEHQAPQDQKAMLASYMRGAVAGSEDVKKLATLVAGGGPYMIKMLQLVGDNVTGENAEDIKRALAFVKGGLPSIAPAIRNGMLLGVVNDSNGQITGLKSVRSLGAASVGETFLAKVEKADGTRETAVVKLLRPGIAQRAGRERVFMDAVAQRLPGMQGTFAGIADQIEAEMDLTSEAANVKLGAVYDERGNPYVQSMKLSEVAAARTNYMLIEQAPGCTVAHYLQHLDGRTDRSPLHPYVLATRMGEMMNDLAEKWVEEALFGSGFYHGDLHAGNLMFDADEGSENGTLTVIDFGNCKVLNPSERQSVFRMMCTAAIKSPQEFCRDFENILSAEGKATMTDEKRAQFLAKIEAAFAQESASTGGVIDKILTAANELSIEVPGAIANFSRSELMLENALRQISTQATKHLDSFKTQRDNDPQLAREMDYRSTNLVKALDRRLSDNGKTWAPLTPETHERLAKVRAVMADPAAGYTALETEDLDFMVQLDAHRPEVERNLVPPVNRLRQVDAMRNATLPEEAPTYSIEKAIAAVVLRHRFDALGLAGLGLTRRVVG